MGRGVRDEGAVGLHFLPLDEAARALGVSRLAVRDGVARGVLPGRRDNRGHLRVDLSGGAAGLIDRLRAAEPPSAGAVDGLFDEIEELTDALAERDARLARAEDLLARQDAALARAVSTLEARAGAAEPEGAGSEAGVVVASEVAGGGEDVPSSSGAAVRDVERIPGELAERTLGALERAVTRLEASEGRERRLLALLDRAGLSGKGGPLARAVEAAEEARARAAEREARLAETEAALERALALGERALAASEGRRPWRLFRRRGEGR